MNGQDNTLSFEDQCVLLNEKQVAKMLGVSLPTLRRWRHEGDGPPCLKLSSLCRYPLNQLEAWLAGLKCTYSVVQEESHE
jgi:predicted DNA-binding transcriptional regulator AlpA